MKTAQGRCQTRGCKGIKDDVRKNTPAIPFRPGGTIHYDVDLALVNVTVTDPYNRWSPASNPTISESSKTTSSRKSLTSPPKCAHLYRRDLDFSGSMSNKVGKAREAALQFFKTANPRTNFFLVSFNERAELTSAFTQRRRPAKPHDAHGSQGPHRALDAIYLGPAR